MKFPMTSTAAAALFLLPQLASAHYIFSLFIHNDKVSRPQEFTREHDNGFMPLKTPDILTSNDIRCNKGSMNHRTQPKTAKVKAGQDTIGFQTAIGNVFHPGPITVSATEVDCDNLGCVGTKLTRHTTRSRRSWRPRLQAT